MGLRVIDEITALSVDIKRVVAEVRGQNAELASQLQRAWCRVATGARRAAEAGSEGQQSLRRCAGRGEGSARGAAVRGRLRLCRGRRGAAEAGRRGGGGVVHVGEAQGEAEAEPLSQAELAAVGRRSRRSPAAEAETVGRLDRTVALRRRSTQRLVWIPAFAGMTAGEKQTRKRRRRRNRSRKRSRKRDRNRGRNRNRKRARKRRRNRTRRCCPTSTRSTARTCCSG